MVETGIARVYLPYVRDINLTCWVWQKWKELLITVVDGWQREDRKTMYTGLSNHSPGTLLLLSFRVQNHGLRFCGSSFYQICGMVVTAI